MPTVQSDINHKNDIKNLVYKFLKRKKITINYR